MNGRTIRLHLVDGVPSGILTAEIMNWTGKVIVSPRSQLDQVATRPEAKRTGVYLLIGTDPENGARDLVYIGEGDNVLNRLRTHNKDEEKEFWTQTVLIISKDDNLTKSHVRYLESRLIGLAKLANRARLANDTSPEPALLPEPDVADMEFFLGQVQMVLPVLGFNFTQQLVAPKPPVGEPSSSSLSPIFVMNPVGTSATAQEVDGTFIVFKNSTARKQGTAAWEKYPAYKGLRDQLIAEGKLIDSDQADFLVFTDNVPFSSPSAAAAVVYGGNQNGRVAWRVKDTGQTYAHWQEEKLANVGNQKEVSGEGGPV
jgi:hypothetical protein